MDYDFEILPRPPWHDPSRESRILQVTPVNHLGPRHGIEGLHQGLLPIGNLYMTLGPMRIGILMSHVVCILP